MKPENNMKRKRHIIPAVCLLFLLLLLTDYRIVKAEPIEKTMTLMVYMIGSDLESGSASATADIAEMQNSGVDFDKVNILICTGGAQKWHSEEIDADKISLFQLNA